MTQFLADAVDVVWGLPLVLFLFAANIALLWHSRFRPLLRTWHGLKLLGGGHEEKNDEGISHFQTFSNAMAATIGMGNISGVAIAVSQGGPGTVFWMWVASIFGMNIKFYECTAALIERGRDHKGKLQGGAMYSLPRILGSKGKPLAYLFAVCGLIGTLSMFQISQLAGFLDTQYKFPGWASGLLFGGLTLWILRGGLPRLSRACALVVPFMGMLYTLICLVVLVMYAERLPDVLSLIVRHALDPQAAVYGTALYTFVHVMVTGIKRATFSNEAGLGTAPMAHADTSSTEPVAEGYVAMLGPLIDTILGCTLTALVVLVVFPNGTPELSGIQLSIAAFEIPLGTIGRHLLGVCVLLFAYATILGMANYNLKCWDYVFKGRLGDNAYQGWYAMTIFAGAVIAAQNVLNLIDIAYALMTIPNIVATLILAPRVKAAMADYDRRNLR